MDKKKENTTEKAISLMFFVSRQIKERYQDERRGKISGVSLETLRFVKEENPLMKEIADYLCITPPSATSLVNNLVEDRLVERTSDGVDRRTVRLRITKQGEKELLKGMGRIKDRAAKILEFLSGKEKKNLIAILEKIAKSNN